MALEIARERPACSSYQNVVADENGRCWDVACGHSVLGASGSGDVLAGAIAGLLARRAEPAKAAGWGTHPQVTGAIDSARASGRPAISPESSSRSYPPSSTSSTSDSANSGGRREASRPGEHRRAAQLLRQRAGWGPRLALGVGCGVSAERVVLYTSLRAAGRNIRLARHRIGRSS